MFQKSPEIERYAAAIISVFEDTFSHLEECRIGYLTMLDDIRMQGRDKAGYAIMPNAMGQNGKLYLWALDRVFHFEDGPPDVLIVISLGCWETMTEIQKVMIVWHELFHVQVRTNRDGEEMYSKEDGRPQYMLLGHGIERFDEEAAIFGGQVGCQEFARNVLEASVDPRVQQVIEKVKGEGNG